MQLYELAFILEGIDYSGRDAWNQTRILISPYMKNVKENFQLPWDDEKFEDIEPTEADKKEVIDYASMIEEMIAKGK